MNLEASSGYGGKFKSLLGKKPENFQFRKNICITALCFLILPPLQESKQKLQQRPIFLIKQNVAVICSTHQYPTSLRKRCPAASHSMLKIEEQSCSKQVDFSQFFMPIFHCPDKVLLTTQTTAVIAQLTSIQLV